MESSKHETIVGRLGSNPKLAYTKKLQPVCEFVIAFYDENKTMIWKKIVVWDQLAESCSVHLKKGQEVFVRGRNVLKSFVNKEGVKKEYFEFRAFSVGASLL